MPRGPLNLSNCDSRTTPVALPFVGAFNSSISDSSSIASKISSIPFLVKADTGIICCLPPQSSGTSSYLARSPLTLSMSAASRSTLLMATIIGTSAAFACVMASIV